jgi:Cathepsin propeptide inhibitor domain (I29)
MMPLKYKVLIATLAGSFLIVLITLIVQSVRLSHLRDITRIANFDVEDDFEDFVKLYNRNYHSIEERKNRLSIFTSNVMIYEQMFKRSREKPERYFSEYSDLTDAEVEERLGYNFKQSLLDSKNVSYIEFKPVNLSATIDWRAEGVVAPVKD